MFKESGQAPDFHVDKWGQSLKGFPSHTELEHMLKWFILIGWEVYVFIELEGDCISGTKILKWTYKILGVCMIVKLVKIDDQRFLTIWKCPNFKKCMEAPCWRMAISKKG